MKIYPGNIMLFTCCLLLAGCAGTKRLPEGKKLYTGGSLSFTDQPIDDQREIKRSLQTLIGPEPNTSFLGQRPGVWIYQRAGNGQQEKGIKSWLKGKFGEAPVLMEEVDVDNVAEQLAYRLVNKGFFHAEVSPEIRIKNRQASVAYQVKAGKPYRIRNIEYLDDTVSDAPGLMLAGLQENSLLAAGMRFDLEDLASERKRIEEVLRNRGYHHFDHDMLIYEADSTTGNDELDLSLEMKDNIPPRAVKKYKISEISIFPGYGAETGQSGVPVSVNNISCYLDPDQIRAGTVADAIKMNVGQYYSAEDEDITIDKLVGLGLFKYININYLEDTLNNGLKARINLVPDERKSIRMQLNAVSKTSNFVGPFLDLSFQDRNLMGGAERFKVSLSSGFEAQLYTGQQRWLNSYEIDLNTSITLPKLMLPLGINEADSPYDFETNYQAGVRTRRRVGHFNMAAFDFMVSYYWNYRLIRRFELIPLNANFFKLTYSSPEFQDLLDNNPQLKNTYQDQVILGRRFSYYYNTRSIDDPAPNLNDFFLNVNVNTAGNLVHLYRYVFSPGDFEDQEANTFLGSPYAQFSKLDFDFRYYRRINARSRLAIRMIAGAGYAYGNSSSLPYAQQFAAGGSNSIRAFRSRSLGPGAYVMPDSLLQTEAFFDQTADIKLQWNIEYRFDIFGRIRGALFFDAGNIWTARQEEERPGGQFRLNKFISQIAMGAGFGIRYDLDFLIFRLDIATPVRLPYGPVHDRWVIGDFNSRDEDRHYQKLLFNIALGYPF